jgi:GPH family glycoside/pentoside/hexuronide:cation symporter
VRTKWGRRRPFLLAGAFACGLTFALAFNVPVIANPKGAAALFAVMLMLQATSYAVFAVPYMAMPVEMTENPTERSRLMSYRVVNGALGNSLGGFATATLISVCGGGLMGHRIMGVLVGLGIFAALISCFAMTKPARIVDVPAQGHPPYAQQLRAALRNRPFVILQCTKLMVLTAAGLHIASAAFFVQRRLMGPDYWLGYIFATLTLGTVISQPLWLWLARRLGKRDAYAIAATFGAASWVAWLPFAAHTPAWIVIAIGMLAGIGNGGFTVIGQSMMPDTIQYHAQLTGDRIEGSFAGLYIVVEKIGQAVGASLTGVVLGLFGYQQAHIGQHIQQSASAVWGIALCYTVIPAGFMMASVAVSRFYPLDERTMTLRGRASVPPPSVAG